MPYKLHCVKIASCTDNYFQIKISFKLEKLLSYNIHKCTKSDFTRHEEILSLNKISWKISNLPYLKFLPADILINSKNLTVLRISYKSEINPINLITIWKHSCYVNN